MGNGQERDARGNIDCRDGNDCVYHRQENCRYRHNNQHETNQRENIQNEYNQNRQHETRQNQSNPNQSSFNMDEMKIPLDNLVQVVYNLKSLLDFPKVNQTKPQAI